MLAAARATRLVLASVTALVLAAPEAGARTDTIYTVAGTGTAGFSGDGGFATAAQLDLPVTVEQLADGGLLIAEQGSSRIRRVAPDGTITTVAGNGTAGFADDDGPATQAEINAPNDVAVRADGGILIADSNNNRVRLVLPNGIISTVAGTGVAGYNGDGVAATAAELSFPAGVAVTADGGFLIADNDNNRIRYVSPAGVISTVAGNGTSGGGGDGGPATSAQIADPGDVEVLADGSFAFTEVVGNRVRLVSAAGIISTVAGTGVAGFSGDGGPAVNAQLNGPIGLAPLAAGGFLVADRGNQRVRRIDAAGVITTVAGVGTAGFSGDGGLATDALVNNPLGVGLAPDGDYLIADATNHRIRRVDSGDLPGPPPPPPPPPPTAGRNLTTPEIVPTIAIAGQRQAYRCDPGRWEGLPTPPVFAYRWWRGTPIAIIGAPKRPSLLSHREIFTPNARELGEPMFCEVLVRDVTGRRLSAVSWPTILSGSPAIKPLPIVKARYGNVRIRGIDVFQVVQPLAGAKMFTYPTGAFGITCGGGTPTAYTSPCDDSKPATPQRVPYSGVVLDARKPTTAVVYVDMQDVVTKLPEQPLNVTLRARLGGAWLRDELTRTIENPPLSITPWVSLGDRVDEEHRFGVTFDLPASWLPQAIASGEQLDLQAHVELPVGAGGGLLVQCLPILVGPDCGPDDTFRIQALEVADDFPELTVQPVPLVGDLQRDTGAGGLRDPSTLLATARQLYPGGERMTVLPYTAAVDITSATRLQASDAACKAYQKDPTPLRTCKWAVIDQILDTWVRSDPRNQRGYNLLMGVHKFLADGTNTEPGWQHGPSLANGSVARLMVHDGSDGRRIRGATHELGHAFGLPHGGEKCANVTEPEGWEPDGQGRLQSVMFRHVNRRFTLVPTRTADTDAAPLYDLMSYCGTEADSWLSARHWSRSAVVLQRLYERLQRPRALDTTRAARAVTGAAFVSGTVTPAGGSIAAVVPAAPGNDAPAADPASPVTVRALDTAGAVLAEVGAPLTAASSEGGSASTFAVAIPAGTVAVELLQGTVVLDRLDRSRPPTVDVQRPATAVTVSTTGALGVRWTASDPDGDELRVTIAYAANGSSGWRDVYAGPNDGRQSIPGSFLEGGQRGRLRVTVTDGFSEASDTSAAFRATGAPPTVTIVAPEVGETPQGGSRIVLRGTAFDGGRNRLRGAALTWFAGTKRLGTGEQLQVRLPAGRTTLRLRARDGAGREETVTRRVTVVPVTLVLTRLDAPARVRAGARTASVTVAASRAALLRAGGRTFTIGPKARTLAIPLAARPKLGVLRIAVRVGDGGTRPAIRETLLVLRV